MNKAQWQAKHGLDDEAMEFLVNQLKFWSQRPAGAQNNPFSKGRPAKITEVWDRRVRARSLTF